MTEGATCTFLWQECFIVFTTKQIMMPRRRQAGSQPVAQAHLQRYNVSLPFVSASVSWAQWDLFSPFVCFQWPINSLDKPTEKDFSRSFLYFFFSLLFLPLLLFALWLASPNLVPTNTLGLFWAVWRRKESSVRKWLFFWSGQELA